MSRWNIIAFDAGGTAIKAALYDECGVERAVARVTMAPLHPAPGCLERDPEAMWRAVCEVSRKVLAVEPSKIAAVGLTGYGNGLYLLNRKGAPVRNGILSPDLRAQAIVTRWRADGMEARTIPRTYQRQWAGKPAPLIAWLEAHEPEALSCADHAMFCKDYLRFRLTGVAGLEVSDLSSGGVIDMRLRQWTPDVLEDFGLAKYARLFGEGAEPLTIVGAVSEQAAAETGLASGTPVSAGYADGPAMALGLGAIDESLISVIAGTWGLNQLSSRTPTTDGSVSAPILGPRPGDFVLTDAGPTSASALEWLVDSILSRTDGSRRSREAMFDFCNEEVLRAHGAEALPYFLPYLNGRLNEPDARGCFIGLASWHGLPEVIRAVYEGVAFEHRAHVDHLLSGRSKPRAARFAGGAARSRPWLEIFSAAIGLPLELAAVDEVGALGAAIVAAVGVKLHPNLETAVAAMTRVNGRVEPNPQLHATLQRRRLTFNALRNALSPAWTML
ncbi:MAG TPA: FGGY-family carbohydrate kinase [Roseiarcus sp.]